MKLWEKEISTDKKVEKFTIGRDNELDLQLAKFDVLGTMAHITMLEKVGLLNSEELPVLLNELANIYRSSEKGEFIIEEGVEDVHSQVELMLTAKLGDMGKKVHSGRSRNDQVLVDLRLYIRDQLGEIAQQVASLSHFFLKMSEQYKDVLIPGYTHLQVAMPSSFGLWFGAYAESLADDLILLQSAYRISNQNPLGSAAGYGSSFPLNRTLTTQLLGFSDLSYNVVYAQMGRGKTEKIAAFALGSVGATLARMAMDACLFMNQNFGFISFPDNLTTGSSIMPHKKNPDVLELIRARGNKLQALSNDITLVMSNLPSGYHRDMQLLKEFLFPAFGECHSIIEMIELMFANVRIKDNILDDHKYDYLFTVETVNKLVLEGTPFRDAYRQISADIAKGTYIPDKDIHHTHEGSIGNLCNGHIAKKVDGILNEFPFLSVEKSIENLLATGSYSPNSSETDRRRPQ
jgi:argininosuccinate lyase